ncbi:MAG TPA: hypothetical protein VNU71_05010, partial [Burkholderiaceae bacterium]|nr:hypothetical protein [Burkholderiaceae bacterium]
MTNFITAGRSARLWSTRAALLMTTIPLLLLAACATPGGLSSAPGAADANAPVVVAAATRPAAPASAP